MRQNHTKVAFSDKTDTQFRVGTAYELARASEDYVRASVPPAWRHLRKIVARARAAETAFFPNRTRRADCGLVRDGGHCG
jgi:hypothetical protein